MYDMTDADGRTVRDYHMRISASLATCDVSDKAMPQLMEDVRKVAAYNLSQNGYTVGKSEDLACDVGACCRTCRLRRLPLHFFFLRVGKMDPRQGAFVFRTASDASVLLLYRKLCLRYLVVWYEQGHARYGLATFAQLLDTVPIHAAHLPHMEDPPLLPTLQHTAHAWFVLASASLAMDRA